MLKFEIDFQEGNFTADIIVIANDKKFTLEKHQTL